MTHWLKAAFAPSALALTLTACAEPAPAVEEKEAEPRTIEFEHEEPTGDGEALSGAGQKSASGEGFATPAVEIGEGWTQAQQTAMATLRDEAVARLTGPAFRARAAQLAPDYTKVWFSKSLGFKDSIAVADFVIEPQAPVSYRQATIIPSNGGAVTGVERGRLLIRLNRDLLKRWQSADPVMRGCAVNTVAHEITHTLTRRADGFFYAFTDTKVGRDARATAPASYFSGNLALCSYLVDQGRIAEADVGKCMKVWYRPGGFQSGRCNAYADGRPVEWR